MSLAFRFRQWRRIQKLKARRRNLLNKFSRAQRRAIEEQGSAEEIARLREIDDRIDALSMSVLFLEWVNLRWKAMQLGLFVEWGEEKDSELFADKEQDTTRKEISELRAAIRKERNERWQFWELRLRVLTALAGALTGAIGAAIGLIAILRK